ncbi:efflux RND transporter permease subunit [Beggiatoa leptomitoformis]|uniref:AcrB/AcrD/AcrF family protein n=1 Tax=Beggiatoa leptomitoformis TaxID=288004 RepID=A0A2N9YCX0_9GAMM|nr:efflux RND transporter permease subunit [Beggiatoa leptomitoformis]ALG69250.1 AcrB/AcrD/AcrF family protein [Beggiatoa leptomitoformis]AUI68312.1 AcrB/AcrD/AcrF family protein [Beggiatoa leptomitoformis]
MAFPNISEWSLQHQALVRYFLVALLVAGILAYNQLGQMEDPEFTIKTMVVRVFWSGASAEEVEQQLTDKIEKKLEETPYLDFLRSYSKAGESTLFINLLDSTPAKAVPDVWYQVRKKVGDIKNTLPSGVTGPFFNDEFGDTFGSIFAFTTDGFNYAELKEYIDDIRQELLRIDDVSKVDIIGAQEEKIYVELSHSKLAALKIDPNLIISTLQAQNVVTPAGTINTESDAVHLRVSGVFDSVESIRSLGISANGHVFRLGDIATVYRGYLDPPTTKMRFEGKEAIGLAVSMRKGGDVILLGKALQETMTRVKQNLPIGIELHQVSNQPAVVEQSIFEFVKVLAEAVIIVLIVSFLSLGFRTGLVVALSIPLVLATVFLVMKFFGIDLQRISLGALIIALGLLVDDAMIAVEMMALKLEQGWGRVRAATFAYSSTAFPMLTGTLITAAAFLPVGMAKSAAGEYTFSMFQVVIIALLISWVVAVLFIPYLGYILLPEHKTPNHEEHHIDVYAKGFYVPFRKMVEFCVYYRKSIILLTFIIFATAIYGFRFVEQQFFPSSNRPELLIDLWLPQGSSYQATEKAVVAMETLLRNDPHIENFVSYVGSGSPRFYLAMDLQLENINFAQIVVMTKGGEGREIVLQKIRGLLDNNFPELRGRVTRLENGPPVGYPVQFRVLGKDLEKLRVIAQEVAELMRQNPYTRNVHLDWNEKAKTVKLDIDQDKARQLGISSETLSNTLNTFLTGLNITEYREKDKLIQIVGRAIPSERSLLGNLDELNIPLANGATVPLSQIARLVDGFEEGVIWRRDRLPVISVRADIVDGIQAPDVTNQLLPVLNAVKAKLPLGYEIQTGGAFESSAKSQKPIATVLPIMFITILTLLMLQLQSMQRAILVLLTAPLGIIGMTIFLLLLQRPFGFVAMLGAISLAGMIMRNSVILVDQIEQDRESGIPAFEAIVGSTVRRFRPIMLTAAAAILAMIPLSESVFWGPLAVTIMGGLLVATVFTLFFLPALYAAWFRVKRE